MDAKQAVAAPKEYFVGLFSEQPTLEEIWFDVEENVWCVTLGIRRRVHTSSYVTMKQVELVDYKVVRIRDSDGQPLSIRNRDVERVA